MRPDHEKPDLSQLPDAPTPLELMAKAQTEAMDYGRIAKRQVESSEPHRCAKCDKLLTTDSAVRMGICAGCESDEMP